MQPTRSNNSSPSLEDGDSIPEMIRLIWSRFGEAQVNLAVCFPRVLPLPAILLPDRGPHQNGRTGTQLASTLLKYAFPPVSLLAQTLCKGKEDEEQVLLVAPFWPTRTWFSRLMLLMTAPPWRILLRHDCSHVVLRPGLDTCLMFPQSGGETASTALGGGRSSLGVAVSRKSIAHIRGSHPEL